MTEPAMMTPGARDLAVASERQHNATFDDVLGRAVHAVVSEPRLALALRNAEHLRLAAAMHSDSLHAARRLTSLVRDGDDVSYIAALHALGTVADPLADRVLLETVIDADEPFAGHAAWSLGARRSSPAAIDALHGLATGDGFPAMLAERTLCEWSALGSAEASIADQRDVAHVTLPRPWLNHLPDNGGVVVVQTHLQAYIDARGTGIGSGDAGGIAALLRSLGNSLGAVDGIDAVLTVTCRPDGADLTESLAGGHRVERIDAGAGTAVSSWRQLWRNRRRIESELTAIGRALTGRRVVWHLRMADVGTLAAAATARRLGHAVVFTAAPDPHVVLDALQKSARLTRRNFGTEDAAHQFWFRARMVERLSAQADRLVLLPGPSLASELEELVGIDIDDLSRRAVEVPEGVDLQVLDAALRRAEYGPPPDAVGAVLDALPPERRALPWLLTVGRLHPTKGPQRVVDAVCSGTSPLVEAVNVVIVGGDLSSPSADEQSTIELIRAAAGAAASGCVTLTGHLPPTDVADLAAYAARHRGVYVCASDKEEFGLAIVEALGAGLAVVAPQRGGPRSYVDHGVTGVLCDTQNPDELRAALATALRLAPDNARSEVARTTVRNRLGVDTMSARLTAVHEAALRCGTRSNRP